MNLYMEAQMAITKYSLRRPSYSSWQDFDDMSNRLSRLFDAGQPSRDRGWSPAVSASENADELRFVVELPGVPEENISVDQRREDGNAYGG